MMKGLSRSGDSPEIARVPSNEEILLAGPLDGHLPAPDVARFLSGVNHALSRKRAVTVAEHPLPEYVGRIRRAVVRAALWRVVLAYEHRGALPAAVRAELNEATRHLAQAHAAVLRAEAAIVDVQRGGR